MKRKKFLDMVMHELNHIKSNATAEEIAKLDIDRLNVIDDEKCIYGQMTGSCYGQRAKELYRKSFYYINPNYFTEGISFTALEKYIHERALAEYGDDCETNSNIIKYLKGQIDTITLK